MKRCVLAVLVCCVCLVSYQAQALTGYKTVVRTAASTGGRGFRVGYSLVGAGGEFFGHAAGKLGAGTIAKLAGRAVAGGLYGLALEAGIKELFRGLNWVMKDGQVTHSLPGSTSPPHTDGGYYWFTYKGSVYYSYAGVVAEMNSDAEASHHRSCSAGCDGPSDPVSYGSRDGYAWGSSFPGIPGYSDQTRYFAMVFSIPDSEPVSSVPPETATESPVSDDAVADAVTQAGYAGDLLNDANGNPVVGPEVAAAVDADAAQAVKGLGDDAQADPVSQPDDYSQPQPSQASTWPAYCDWAARACDYYDRMEAKAGSDEPPSDDDLGDLPPLHQPGEVSEPSQDLGDTSKFDSSGYGWGASCPFSAIPIDIMGTSATVDMTPICEYGPWMRGFVLLLAAVGCARIVGGLKTGGIGGG